MTQQNDWILDVLSDLSAFARGNEMPMLVAALEKADAAARFEMSMGTNGGPGSDGFKGVGGRDTSTAGLGHNA